MVCSVAKISGERGRYYLNHYYNEELGEQGWFAGSGTEHFGVENDSIEHKDYRLENLLDGKSPDGTERLKLGGDTERIYKDRLTGQPKAYKKLSGFDFCLSDPKSLSVLDHLANNGEVSNEIERCRDVAQQAAMDYISDFCQIRKKTYDEQGKEVYTYRKAAPIFACFQHHLSRELDPQCHRHLLLMSGAIGLDDPSIKGSLDTREFFKMRYTVGMIYLNTLRHELETGKLKLKTFDIPFKEEKGKSFGIHGVPPGLCRELSKRSQQVEAELEKNPEMTGAQVQSAVLKTRKKKQKFVDMSPVQEDWEEKGRKHGFKLSKICPALVKKPSKVIDLKSKLEERQKKAQDIKHHAAMARSLREKEDVTFHQVMTASVTVGGSKLSSAKAKEYADRFVSKYTNTRKGGGKYGSSDRHSLRHEAYTLPESSLTMTEKTAHAARVLIHWQQGNRIDVLNQRRAGADKRAEKFERRALGLFLMGRIGRVQYLACKAKSPYEGKEFKLEVYHALHLISKAQKNRLMKMAEKRASTPYIVREALKEKRISQHMANILIRQDRDKVLKEKEKEAKEKELKANQRKERSQQRIEKVRSFGGLGR
ncbi:relaxase domain-containing protein [Waterburya agarophytonicola K14]|uniref:Relaxase domain-containing protein n=1 Tax=Waterburya agarophytonicola KI4 TaxID=2874699 RepID=A0A964FI49_9CYAN|nr:MobF family relaxase [Waterburya agarophytonicola]MCC0178048.1 relaxase domain-containing protein [Waterburya agarophytonicola KI4]